MENKLDEYLYNVGSGKDVTIKTLAETIQRIIGHHGDIIWDRSKPDGTPRKLMDVSKMKAVGWQYETELEQGIQKTYKWFLNNIKNFKQIINLIEYQRLKFIFRKNEKLDIIKFRKNIKKFSREINF